MKVRRFLWRNTDLKYKNIKKFQSYHFIWFDSRWDKMVRTKLVAFCTLLYLFLLLLFLLMFYYIVIKYARVESRLSDQILEFTRSHRASHSLLYYEKSLPELKNIGSSKQ